MLLNLSIEHEVALVTKSPAPSNPTALLLAWGRGDQAAFDELVPLVHEELRQIARQHMGHERARRFRKRGGGVAMGLMDEAPVRPFMRPRPSVIPKVSGTNTGPVTHFVKVTSTGLLRS